SRMKITMFGFSSKNCPVSDDVRGWVEQRSAWCVKTFGMPALRARVMILPTPEFFPDAYDCTEEAGGRLFLRICEYAQIDPGRVELRWITGKHDDRGGAMFIEQKDGAAGTYHAEEARQIITIDRANLRDPMKLTATIAH